MSSHVLLLRRMLRRMESIERELREISRKLDRIGRPYRDLQLLLGQQLGLRTCELHGVLYLHSHGPLRVS